MPSRRKVLKFSNQIILSSNTKQKLQLQSLVTVNHISPTSCINPKESIIHALAYLHSSQQNVICEEICEFEKICEPFKDNLLLELMLQRDTKAINTTDL